MALWWTRRGPIAGGEFLADPDADPTNPGGIGSELPEGQRFPHQVRGQHRQADAVVNRLVGPAFHQPTEPEPAGPGPISPDFRDAQLRVDRQPTARADAVIDLD